MVRKPLPAVAAKTFCEFFAGIGLVREGLLASGWQCVYANDVDAKKQQMYAACFGPSDEFHLGDVWQTDEVVSSIPIQPFLATASFPCVDLSLAGHRRGFDGEHSSTFFGFLAVLEALGDRRPPVVMLENVPGFVTGNEGKDFAAVAASLAGLGYWIDAFVLDAERFVPQSRPRVFVLGVQGGFAPPGAVRQIRKDGLMDPWQMALEAGDRALRPPKLTRLMQQTTLPTGWLLCDVPPPPPRQLQLAEVIDLDDGQEWWAADEVQRHYRMMSDLHRGQVDVLIATKGRHVGTIYRRVRKGSQKAEVRFDGVAGCLRTPRGGSAKQIVIVVDGGRLRMRWMSPREYARLQGAGDFPLTADRIQLLFGFGDAVCVPVISWIDRHVLTPAFDAAQQHAERNGHGG
jgi:DNA (cytosine-5)-methyltransferase 1